MNVFKSLNMIYYVLFPIVFIYNIIWHAPPPSNSHHEGCNSFIGVLDLNLHFPVLLAGGNILIYHTPAPSKGFQLNQCPLATMCVIPWKVLAKVLLFRSYAFVNAPVYNPNDPCFNTGHSQVPCTTNY